MLRCNGNIECSVDGRSESASDPIIHLLCGVTSTSYGISTHSALREFDALLLPSTDFNRIVWGGGVQKERLLCGAAYVMKEAIRRMMLDKTFVK